MEPTGTKVETNEQLLRDIRQLLRWVVVGVFLLVALVAAVALGALAVDVTPV